MRGWGTRKAVRIEEPESVSNRVGLQGAACQPCAVFEVQGRIITAAARPERAQQFCRISIQKLRDGKCGAEQVVEGSVRWMAEARGVPEL